MSYSQPDNDAVDFTLEDYSQPDNDAVDFSLDEDVMTPTPGPTPPADRPDFNVSTDPIDLPLSLDLPTAPLNMRSMNVGVSLFLVGMMGLLGGGIAWLRNAVAGIMWSFALFALIASGLFGIGLELFWAMVGATIFLLMVGMIVRWIG